VMTAAGIPFLVLYKNHPMFGSRFRVGYLFPLFLGLYLVLLCYQWVLLHTEPRKSSAAEWLRYHRPAASRVLGSWRATH
jgi:hypothetical protein